MSRSVNAPSAAQKWMAGILVIGYAIITLLPLVWIVATGFKSSTDSIAYPPKIIFQPTAEGYVNLFTTQTRISETTRDATAGEDLPWYENLVRGKGNTIVGASRFPERFMNSVIIGFGSTFFAIMLGTATAYAFSRFKVPPKDDLLFFILSTRMMSPIAVAIPIFLMFRQLGLSDTHAGMILLYTAVNLSLSVWLICTAVTNPVGSGDIWVVGAGLISVHWLGCFSFGGWRGCLSWKSMLPSDVLCLSKATAVVKRRVYPV